MTTYIASKVRWHVYALLFVLLLLLGLFFHFSYLKIFVVAVSFLICLSFFSKTKYEIDQDKIKVQSKFYKDEIAWRDVTEVELIDTGDSLAWEILHLKTKSKFWPIIFSDVEHTKIFLNDIFVHLPESCKTDSNLKPYIEQGNIYLEKYATKMILKQLGIGVIILGLGLALFFIFKPLILK